MRVNRVPLITRSSISQDGAFQPTTKRGRRKTGKQGKQASKLRRTRGQPVDDDKEKRRKGMGWNGRALEGGREEKRREEKRRGRRKMEDGRIRIGWMWMWMGGRALDGMDDG
ncbi:hypothetical protein TWF506_006555 [Arthrobotrys conoides]|uniref:Uncharacterized protein n=1 Tax=Arthrobotrys conoides TaxID=74498 RepID=A0AAN8RV98_9PEZI